MHAILAPRGLFVCVVPRPIRLIRARKPRDAGPPHGQHFRNLTLCSLRACSGSETLGKPLSVMMSSHRTLIDSMPKAVSSLSLAIEMPHTPHGQDYPYTSIAWVRVDSLPRSRDMGRMELLECKTRFVELTKA